MILHLNGRSGRRLERSFYLRADTATIAKELLGKLLVMESAGERRSGLIVETEAYLGVEDRACHAFQGRNSARTAVMYAVGGTAYMYLCYGIHHLFIVVVGSEGIPHVILVRALQPVEGIAQMCLRRKQQELKPRLTAGQGALSQALGITTSHSGTDLLTGELAIEDHGIMIDEEHICASARVGVSYAGADALLPLRFRLQNNPWTSPAK